jgi:hypothetical protein
MNRASGAGRPRGALRLGGGAAMPGALFLPPPDLLLDDVTESGRMHQLHPRECRSLPAQTSDLPSSRDFE